MLSRKKLLAGTLALLVIVWIEQTSGMEGLHPSIGKAMAQGTAGNPTTDVFNTMTVILGILVTAANSLSFITFPILEVVLEPNFFLEIHKANETTILHIWQVSRDIVNVIFAFMLIAGACLTVITAKKDIISRFAIKFVLAVILVNFSWFFPRVILDVGNILAATVYQLPRMVGTTCQYRDIHGNITSPCTYPTDFAFFDEAKHLKDANPPPGNWKCPLETFCYEAGALSNNTNTASGILSGLIFNHAKLPHLAQVPANSTGGPSTDPLDQVSFFLMFILKAIVLLGLSFALFLVMLALLVAFLIRIPILWLTMAFMPFMFVGFVVGDLMRSFNTMKIFEHFVKAAFLPAVTAIPLTVGYIVINAVSFAAPPSSADILQDAVGRFLPGVDNLWVVMWQITIILLIWHGFWMALSIDSIYENSTKMIRTFGGNIGTLVKNLPINIPVIPAGTDPKTGKTVFKSIGKTGSQIAGITALSRQGRLLEKGAVEDILSGGKKSAVTAAANDIRDSGGTFTKIKDAASSGDMNKLASAINSLGDKIAHLNPDEKIQALQKALQGTGITMRDDKLEELKRVLGTSGGGTGSVRAGEAGGGNT